MRSGPLDTRQQILRAALHEFSACGVQGTSVRQIAAQANLTTGALYHHFSSKEDLLQAVIEPAATALMEVYAKAHAPAGDSQDSATGASQRATDAVLDMVYASLPIYRLLLTDGLDGPYPTLLEDLARMERTRYRQGLKAAGVSQGRAADLFLSTVAQSSAWALRRAVISGLNRQEAGEYLALLTRFHATGWAGLLPDVIVPTSQPQQGADQ